MYHTTDGFNSHHGSAVQRLPNGNTMAQLARVGRLLEITPEGEVVWEYVNPVTNAGIVKTIVTSEHENTFGGWSPLRYGVDFPGLAGKDLSPKGPITAFHDDENPREGMNWSWPRKKRDIDPGGARPSSVECSGTFATGC